MSDGDKTRALERWENEGGSTAVVLRDAVCGTVVTDRSPHRHQHDGRVFYFCSATCRAKFVAEVR